MGDVLAWLQRQGDNIKFVLIRSLFMNPGKIVTIISTPTIDISGDNTTIKSFSFWKFPNRSSLPVTIGSWGIKFNDHIIDQA